jgi:hypothetical protein
VHAREYPEQAGYWLQSKVFIRQLEPFDHCRSYDSACLWYVADRFDPQHIKNRTLGKPFCDFTLKKRLTSINSAEHIQPVFLLFVVKYLL